MRILAIDLGEKRTGTAICDEKEIISYPLKVILEENRNKLVEKISNIVKESKVEMILVGFAKNMDGSSGEKAKKCQQFAQNLKKELNIPITLWDERQTTKLAMRFMNESHVNKKKKKKIVDCVSATIILDSFIEFRKNKNEVKLV